MRIRDLSIATSSLAKMPDSLDKREFNVSCWHVQEIFLHFLPREYVLDGMAKTNITCGFADGQDIYAQLINVNRFYVEDFDFQFYAASTKEERENIVLETIKNSLIAIAKNHGSEIQPIIDAYQSVLDSNFYLKIETKLSRSTKSRRLRLKVIREIRHSGEDWYINVCSRKGEVYERVVILENLMVSQGLHMFRKSYWDCSSLIIVDHVGKESFQLDVLPLEEKYEST